MRFFLVFLFSSTLLFSLTIDETKAAQLAKDAYLDKTKFTQKYASSNSIKVGKIKGVQYYILEDDQNTIITIRGTSNVRNLLSNIFAVEESFLNYEDILVHKGFYEIALKLFKKTKLNTKKPIYLMGHSLGGAISLLYGAMLYEKGLDPIIYSFGMPPIVNKPFLSQYKSIKHYRYFHIFDPIPSLSKPTIQIFKTQLQFKDFQSAKNSITNMIDTIQNIPDKYRHHGYNKRINIELSKLQNLVKDSLFFKTTSLYFDYHKILNYKTALEIVSPQYKTTTKNQDMLYSLNKKQTQVDTKTIEIIPSITQGTIPLEVEFYVDTAGHDMELYYFNFGGKEVLKRFLPNDKISYTFKSEGKHTVKIALKDKFNNMVETKVIITTREPTFKEYQDAFGKEFLEFLEKNR